jgi:hypothetical protein
MIIKNRAAPQRPLVSVTVRASATQIRIAFNADLVRQASLQDVRFMAIDFDEERHRVTFISTPSRKYKDPDDAYPLMPDGGRKSRMTAGKALAVPTDQFVMLYRQAPRRYEPQIQSGRAGPRISIALELEPASYADSEAWLGGGGQTEAKRRAAPSMGKCSEVKPPKGRQKITVAGQKVFIGHGRSPVWRELKDFLQDSLHLTIDEFTRVPIAGVATSNRLEEMLEDAAFAFLILTAEDEAADGKLHARENVVHEAGLFQGKLGFKKAILLLEDTCEKFSNIEGLGYIPFPTGKIRAAFEDIRKVLNERLIASEPGKRRIHYTYPRAPRDS